MIDTTPINIIIYQRQVHKPHVGVFELENGLAYARENNMSETEVLSEINEDDCYAILYNTVIAKVQSEEFPDIIRKEL